MTLWSARGADATCETEELFFPPVGCGWFFLLLMQNCLFMYQNMYLLYYIIKSFMLVQLLMLHDAVHFSSHRVDIFS